MTPVIIFAFLSLACLWLTDDARLSGNTPRLIVMVPATAVYLVGFVIGLLEAVGVLP